MTLGALTEAGARYLGPTESIGSSKQRPSESPKRDTGLRLQRLLPGFLGLVCQPLLRLLSRFRLQARSRELLARSRELLARSRGILARTLGILARTLGILARTLGIRYSYGLGRVRCDLGRVRCDLGRVRL